MLSKHLQDDLSTFEQKITHIEHQEFDEPEAREPEAGTSEETETHTDTTEAEKKTSIPTHPLPKTEAPSSTEKKTVKKDDMPNDVQYVADLFSDDE